MMKAHIRIGSQICMRKECVDGRLAQFPVSAHNKSVQVHLGDFLDKLDRPPQFFCISQQNRILHIHATIMD